MLLEKLDLHYPNIAVACSEEQVVYVNMDKSDGNKINIASGALEDPYINNKVIDVLEGTFPALTTRTNTYKIRNR